jgi:FkbM family methyltransferase
MQEDSLTEAASGAAAAAGEPAKAATGRPPRVAVITPYYREDDAVLRACLKSVRDQTHRACRHFLIADGHPNPLVEEFAVAHIRLPQAHGDNGDLARCVGALAAIAEGFDAIAFLDADNWYRPDHLARMVALHIRTGVALCTSGRSIHRLDGSLLAADDQQSDGEEFTDTSCLCFFRPAFDLVTLWGAMPRDAGPICDRLMWDAVKLRGISRAHDAAPSVGFRSQYVGHYRQAGEAPPHGAKTGKDLARAWEKFRAIPYPLRLGMLLGAGSLQALQPPPIPGPGGGIRTRSLAVPGTEHSLELALPDDEAARLEQRRIFEREPYRPVAGLQPPRAICDIGAGAGLAAAYFRLVYPQASLVCLEPDPRAYRLLARNAAAIGDCLPVRVALTLGAETHPFFIARNGDAALMIDAERFLADLNRDNIDLIKVDAGAAALPILLSLKKRLARTAMVLVECEDRTDRRVIAALLDETHAPRHGGDHAAGSGALCYVLRAPPQGRARS